jgi:hypothetical protein
MSKLLRFASEQPGNKSNVDRTNGKLNNVVIIQVGLAKGHEVNVIPESLTAFMSVVKTQLKSFLTHGEYYGADRIGETLGWFENFRIVGTQVLADFTFYPSTIVDMAKDVAKIFDMAELTPGLFGMSISFQGTVVPGVDGALPHILPTEIISADFVSEPAATNSLFSRVSKSIADKIYDFSRGNAADPLVKEYSALQKQLNEVKAEFTTQFEALKTSHATELSTLKATHATEKTELATKVTTLETEVTRLRTVRAELSAATIKVPLPDLTTTVTNIKNPFSKKDYNLTEQSLLFLSDRPLALQLKQAAALENK